MNLIIQKKSHENEEVVKLNKLLEKKNKDNPDILKKAIEQNQKFMSHLNEEIDTLKNHNMSMQIKTEELNKVINQKNKTTLDNEEELKELNHLKNHIDL